MTAYQKERTAYETESRLPLYPLLTYDFNNLDPKISEELKQMIVVKRTPDGGQVTTAYDEIVRLKQKKKEEIAEPTPLEQRLLGTGIKRV